MASQNKNRADFECAAFVKSLPALRIVEDVFAGTLRMRACSTTYLPRNPAEDDGEYANRLKRAVFHPFFKRALQKLVGMIMREEPNLKDVPDQIREYWKNIDGAGTSGEVFLSDALLQAAKDGHSLIYVDMPPPITESETESPEPTLHDEALANIRPHAILYRKGQAVNFRTEVIDGQSKLTMIVFRECTKEADGDFGEKEVVRFRVLRPRSWTLYRQVGRKVEFERDGATNLDYIPVFPVYGEKSGEFESDPLLLELAHQNIQLFQKQSDLDNILHFANVPVMWARDRNVQVPFQMVGPSILIDLKGEHSEIGFAEHQGHAIEAAQKDIDSLKTDMAMAALELFAPRAQGPKSKEGKGQKTATGALIDAAESNSALSLVVKSLQLAGQLMLDTMQRYDNPKAEPKGTLELNVVYERLVLSVEELRLLKELVSETMLSIETLLELLKRAGKLGKDFDIKKELKRLFGEGAEGKSQVELTAMLDTTRSSGQDEPPDPDGTKGKEKPLNET